MIFSAIFFVYATLSMSDAVCPMAACVNPCTDYTDVDNPQPKCAEYKVCKTQPTFDANGCQLCDEFVGCDPCPIPGCLDPCWDYSVDPSAPQPRCGDEQQCVTEPTVNSEGCESCPRFVECADMPCPVFRCRDPCIDVEGESQCKRNEKCVFETPVDSAGCKYCPIFIECVKNNGRPMSAP
eukprot:CAMPEP_0202708386 /NCGR_PEP_ID=MMETSP1385-20130828/20616_1 /ASSEMBLY_ACC=CAM_ASM_000861 /TAXON_ID=933848 /ORGANISM="Elphidium margaritaceum" /LENGTH=180 /DNA_ID=CAMNT_0049367353 /DNA_START=41 /DNA_END=583 /DNA_ORIENTATION=-